MVAGLVIAESLLDCGVWICLLTNRPGAILESWGSHVGILKANLVGLSLVRSPTSNPSSKYHHSIALNGYTLEDVQLHNMHIMGCCRNLDSSTVVPSGVVAWGEQGGILV